MDNKIEEEKALFLEQNNLKELFPTAEKIDNNLWCELQSVGESYDEYSGYCDGIAEKFLLEVLNSDELKNIHSARYRIKGKNSLLVKIVKKKAVISQTVSKEYEIEKYRDLNSDNYYKIMTDLIGFRILIRYREQWQVVDNWIRNKFYKGDEHYIKNFVEDYQANPKKAFIAEKPKVYYRNQQDLSFYEQIGKDFFDFVKSDKGYNSIHYIINIDGKYMEIQVRTIFDEAWCECTHDIVYKNTKDELKEELEYLSKCLAQQTIASESIANLMYEKVNTSGVLYGSIGYMADFLPVEKEKSTNIVSDISAIEKRIKKLNIAEDNFDGNINNLI